MSIKCLLNGNRYLPAALSTAYTVTSRVMSICPQRSPLHSTLIAIFPQRSSTIHGNVQTTLTQRSAPSS